MVADIAGGAGIGVITGLGIGGEDTLAVIARLVRAGVAVFAVEGGPGLTDAFEARVVDGAGIAIIACAIARGMGAASIGEATIDGACIAIIACKGTRPDAGPFDADVGCGACIFVVTGKDVGGEEASEGAVAGIVGTGIAIVAGERRGSAGACPV